MPNIKKRIFRTYPEAEDVVEHLISKTEKKLKSLEESKSVGLKFWSDERFARYDRDRYNNKTFLNQLKELQKEIEYHEIAHDVGMEMSGQMDQEETF